MHGGPNGFSSTIHDPSIPNATASATGTYTVTVTDANGCMTSATTTAIVYGTVLYVNDNSSVGDVYTTAVGSDANPGTAAAPLATIGKAIQVSLPGYTIYVDAGEYVGNITISKGLDIRGSNYNVSPNTGVRVAESVILPGSTNTSSGAAVTIATGGVSFRGFTVDGDNPGLASSGVGLGGTLGTSIDAARTILLQANGINGVTIAENIAKNGVNGIRIEQTTNYFATTEGALRSTNIVINDNKVHDMTGTGIRLGKSMYAKVTNNTVSNADNGIAFSSFRISDSGSATDRVIENNTISARYAGIWVNLFHASPYAIRNNTITPAPAATLMAPTPQVRTAWYGIMYSTASCPQNFTNQVSLPLVGTPEWWTCTNNDIDGSALESSSTGYGYWFYYVDNNRDALGVDHFGQISGGTVSNVDCGIMLKNKDTDAATNFGNSAIGAHANVSGVAISLRSGGTGIKMIDDASWVTGNPAPLINKRDVKLGIGTGVTIIGGAKGIEISHPATGTANYTAYSSITSGALNNISISGQSGEYIMLTNHPNGLDGTLASFDGNTGGLATLGQNYAIEDKISHKVDNSTRGLVRVKASNIFVTTSAGSIQRGIDAASSGDVINIQGGSYTSNGDAATAVKDVTLAPGSSPACVTMTGNLSVNSGDAIDMEVGSTTACTGYDQLTVNGTVSLGGATLNLTLDPMYTPDAADRIVLINNDGTDVVTGTFAQGTSITVGSYKFSIIYNGDVSGSGSGNDVVLALAPSISCPSEVTQNTDAGVCNAVVRNIGATATGYDLTVEYGVTGATEATGSGDASGAIIAKGSSTVTYTVTDAAEQTASCSFSVTINDDEVPTITAPAGVTVNADAGVCTTALGGVSLGTPTTSDNCTEESTTNDAPATFVLGSNTVVWTVTDGSGNTATATQTVTVVDNQNPTITCSDPIIVNTDADVCTYASSKLAAPSVDDNCIVGIVVASPASLVLGPNTVLWTVMDGSGNTATCEQTVTVIDYQNPEIFNTPASFTATRTCAGPVSWTPPTASDNCTLESFTSNYSPGSNFPVGETEVIYTAVDEAGNITTVSFIVTIIEFSISTTSTNITCNGTRDGTASVSTQNTQGNVSYLWSNGKTTATISGLAKGTYSVTVTNGPCTKTGSVIITEPARLSATYSSSNVTCFGLNNGVILFQNPTGGYGTYEYSINNGISWQSSTLFTGLAPALYTLVIRDAQNPGCRRTLGTVTISQPALLSVSVTVSPGTTICPGATTKLTAVPSGTTTGITYLWSNGATANFINVNVAGTYKVTITNLNGCTASSTAVSINEAPFLTASVSITANIPDPVTPLSSITFTATPVNGGTSPNFSWRRNGVIVGTNSNTYVGTGWTNGESVQCVLTSNAPCVVGSPATSNAIIITIPLGSVKYVISDVTANRVFYYDQNMLFLSSSQLSTTALNGVTNVEDLWATSDKIYILDGKNKRVYRTNGPNSPSTICRPLRSNLGQALNVLTGIAIIGDHLLVFDKSAKALYRYSLSQAFSGTANYNALQRIALNANNFAAEALTYDPVTNNFYVLDNGTTKAFYRYPFSINPSTGNFTLGTATRSRPIRTNAGGALSTATGAVVDGAQLRITDRGLDRSYSYSIADLFTGSNTVNLNASSSNALNSGNLNSTGISLVNSTILARGLADNNYDLNNNEFLTEEIVVRIQNNPATNYFVLTVKGLTTLLGTEVHIFNESGQTMYASFKEAGITSLYDECSVVDYVPGVYYVSVTHGTQRKILKLIVLK